jgi:methylmalonyl-CoA mutase cobalamin-binding subunit
MRMGDFAEGSMSAEGSVNGASEDAAKEGARAGTLPECENGLSESEIRMARLVRTIEGEIVPRLVLARRVSTGQEPVNLRQARAPDACDVTELVRLLLSHDTGVGSAYVETVRQRGVSLEVICLDLLAPAARELGLLWEEDECDFMQVTVGLCRLHQVLRDLSPAFGIEDLDHEADRRILLSPYPGDQHTFGISVVAQFLRRAGWDVWHESPRSTAELLDLTRQNWFAAIGLSVGTEARLDDVASTINAVRQTSRNRAVGVLVGGPILVDKPELAATIGADGTAADGRQAVQQAERIRGRQGAST